MSAPVPAPRVVCVLVAYRPEAGTLRAALDSITPQAQTTIVVDNTEASRPAADVGGAVRVALGRNLGVAAAQNRGIELALAQGADFIWLSDQDTVYPPDFVQRMLACAARCAAEGQQVAALAPAFFDVHAQMVRPFIRHAPFVQGFEPLPGANLVADAIASGTIIPAAAARTVGPMQEDLFVDWVDIEWCWRARNRFGLQVIGVGDVVIRHTLGDRLVRFAGRTLTVRSPRRHYYIIRNAVYLALYSRSASWPMRLQIAFRAVLWTVALPLAVPDQKRAHARACSLGFWHGLTARLGPYDPAT